MNTFISDISNQEFPIDDKVLGSTVRHPIMTLIQKEHPQFTDDNALSISELNTFRQKYIENFLTKQTGGLSYLEKTVLDSLKNKDTLSDKIDGEEIEAGTFGQRIADKVAAFGGSWKFIISFGVFLFAWIGLNIFWYSNKGFDPYPFILLNLILSSLAALQAPVIMMSQNRQEEKDRERGKKDYMVNLKAELEVRVLDEKIDHLILHQQQEVIEIHKMQLEMLNDILKQIKK